MVNNAIVILNEIYTEIEPKLERGKVSDYIPVLNRYDNSHAETLVYG